VAHNGSFADVAKEFAKQTDFSAGKALRVKAMSQLQNYSREIAAISAGASGSWIADDAKTTTTDVQAVVQDAGASAASKLLTANAGTVQSAVSKLGEAIVGAEAAKDLQKLAQDASAPLAEIANMIQQDEMNIETDQFAAGLKTDQTQALHDILHSIYDDSHVNAFDRWQALQTVANWKPSLITKGQAIKAALQELQAANDAMAKKEKVSLGSFAQALYADAKQASSNPSAGSAAN
jgi:hypothetical protein